MKKWKIWLGVVLVLGIAGAIFASVKMNQRGVVTVQTGKANRQDLASIVTASGEIKPRTYINIGANATGRIVELFVKEGDRVRKNQILARIESVQAEAEVRSQRASVDSAEADSSASEAGLKSMDDSILTQQAGVERAKTELDRAKIEFDRSAKLFNDKLIARQDYDQKKAAVDAQIAAVREAEARVVQMKSQRAQTAAQMNASQRRVTQIQANLARVSDMLAKQIGRAHV